MLEGVELRPELISLVIGKLRPKASNGGRPGSCRTKLHELASEVVAVAKAERPADKVRSSRSSTEPGAAGRVRLYKKKARDPFP